METDKSFSFATLHCVKHVSRGCWRDTGGSFLVAICLTCKISTVCFYHYLAPEFAHFSPSLGFCKAHFPAFEDCVVFSPMSVLKSVAFSSTRHEHSVFSPAFSCSLGLLSGSFIQHQEGHPSASKSLCYLPWYLSSGMPQIRHFPMGRLGSTSTGEFAVNFLFACLFDWFLEQFATMLRRGTKIFPYIFASIQA